jgi:D-amino peptidase
MKLYISADIEGVAGITNWEEARKEHAAYPEFREAMTAEVVAACEGAIAAGARDILIKDAHGTGRNIIGERLPDCARLIRGWSGHPLCMVQELDESFDAIIFLGYHSRAGSDANPLAHTLSLKVSRLAINGEAASELLMHSLAAAMFKVPVAFVSGDKGICADALALNANIIAAPVSEGIGPSTLSLAPRRARTLIRDGVRAALARDLAPCRIALPDSFVLEIAYDNPVDAYRASWYPGMAKTGPQTVRFENSSYFELLRAIRFVI